MTIKVGQIYSVYGTQTVDMIIKVNSATVKVMRFDQLDRESPDLTYMETKDQPKEWYESEKRPLLNNKRLSLIDYLPPEFI